MRWLKRGLVGIGALLLCVGIAVAVFGWWVLPSPGFQEWLHGRVARVVGEELAFDDVSLALWPAPGIRVHRVSIGDGPDATRFESLVCVVAPDSLLSGQLVLQRVVLERPVLDLRRAPDGRWIFADPLQRVLDRAAHSPRERDPSRGRAGLPRLVVHEGTLHVIDEHVDGGPVELSIEDFSSAFTPPAGASPGIFRLSMVSPDGARLQIDATLEPLGAEESLVDSRFEARVRGDSLSSDKALLYLLFGLPIRNTGGSFDVVGEVARGTSGAIEGRATLTVSDRTVDGWGIRLATPVAITGDFSVVEGQFSLHGAVLDAVGTAIGHLKAGTTRAHFDWVDDQLRMEKLVFESYGGNWTAHGIVDFRGEPHYDAAVEAGEVDMRRLASALSGTTVETGFETMEGKSTLRGVFTDPATWTAGAAGDGSVRMARGLLQSSPIFSGIWRGLLRSIPGLSNLIDERPPPTQLDHLTASFTFADERAHSKDLVIVTDQYELAGTGSLGFDGSVEISGKVALTTRGAAQLNTDGSDSFVREKSKALPEIPVHVSGPVSSPRVNPDMAGLPVAPFRALFDSSLGAATMLRDVAAPTGRFLKDGFERMIGSPDSQAETEAEVQPPGGAAE